MIESSFHSESSGGFPQIKTDLQNLAPSKACLVRLSIFVLILGIYCYPAIRTTAVTGSRALPPILAPDLTLYLNISGIHESGPTQVLDPYYGVIIPKARIGYLKFRFTFLCFRLLNEILRGNLWSTVFVWNLIWWGLLTLVGLWFFQELLPDRSTIVVIAAVAILMLFNFGILQSQLSAWLHPFSLASFQKIELPYVRSFFPQVPAPLLLLYLGLQTKALQKNQRWLWAALAIIQFLAFTIFPFAMLMMAGITAVALLAGFLSGSFRLPWGTVTMYGIACAFADASFLLHGNEAARSGAPGQYALIQVRPSALPHTIGGMWVLLLALTVGVFFLRELAPAVKWPILGLGITNLLLLMGDALFSETALQVSHHAGYFVHISATILIVMLMSAGARYVPKYAQLFWVIIIVFVVINGMLIAHATYRSFLPANQQHADLAALVRAEPMSADDLVIARSLSVDDDCGWVPLLSPTRVLYCRSAQVLLSPQQNRDIQRFRQALYLHFTGRDSRWVERVLEDPNAIAELTRLTFLGQVTASLADRQQAIDSVRTELIPILSRLENHDPGMQAFFSNFRHVFVIDDLANPFFQQSRISAYLTTETQTTYKLLQISKCTSAKP